MSTPRRRRKDLESLTHVVDTPLTLPGAMTAVPNAVETFATEPTHEDITCRAYQLYEERGGEHSQDLDDWFKAERELRQFLEDVVGKIVATEGPYAVA